MKRVSHTGMLEVNATPQEVFPLFTPRGETKWAEDWEPEFIYPSSGEAGVGNIFKTYQSEVNGRHETNWVTVEHDPENFQVSYINVTPDIVAMCIDVRCQPAGEAATKATVTYTLTALSVKGSKTLDRTTDVVYSAMMESWEKSLNHYLKTGEILPHH